MEISWTDRMRNKEVIHSVNEERQTYLTSNKQRKVNWTVHTLNRNCFLKHVIERKIEGRIEGTRREGRRLKQLLVDLKETSGYWKLKDEALDRTMENYLCKRLQSCRKSDCRMSDRHRMTQIRK